MATPRPLPFDAPARAQIVQILAANGLAGSMVEASVLAWVGVLEEEIEHQRRLVSLRARELLEGVEGAPKRPAGA